MPIDKLGSGKSIKAVGRKIDELIDIIESQRQEIEVLAARIAQRPTKDEVRNAGVALQ
jgi:hypothetical protein